MPADINGDGRKDLIHVRTDNGPSFEAGGELIFIPHLATGSGGFSKQPIYRTGVHYNGGENTLVTVIPADINGDGREDLIHIRTNNNELIFISHLSNGVGGFTKQAIYQTGILHDDGGGNSQGKVLAADINADGRKDLIHVRTDNGKELIFIVHLSNAIGGFTKQGIYRTGVTQKASNNNLFTTLSAGVNSDRRDDIVHVRTDDNNLVLFIVHLSNGTGSFSQQIYQTGMQTSE